MAIKTSESSEYLLDLALCDEIDPSKSTTSYLSTKVEIRLAKLRQAKWVSLEQVEAPFKTVAWDDASNVNKAEYPSSNKIKKNWDLIAKDIVRIFTFHLLRTKFDLDPLMYAGRREIGGRCCIEQSV